jgi:fluoroquinolone transport system permease protein
MVADSRLLWRDPLLAWVLLLPIGLAVLFRGLLPRISESLSAAVGFDPAVYYPLIMGGYLMTAPGIVGMVVGFLLLDERDQRTLSALRVTPLSMRRYLAYRVTLPLLAGTATTLVGYPLVGITRVPATTLLPMAAVAALSAPSLALVLATAAPNKVAGFAVVKLLNVINLLPIVAFFVPPPLQCVAGILPAFWPMRALWAAAAGEPFTPYLVVGSIVGAGAIGITAALFNRRLLQRA